MSENNKEKYNKVEIREEDRVISGFICSFCNRIFDNADKVKQVVVAKGNHAKNKDIKNFCKVRWMCDICVDAGATRTIDGLDILDNESAITADQIEKEWGHHVYSEYRKLVMREGNKVR